MLINASIWVNYNNSPAFRRYEFKAFRVRSGGVVVVGHRLPYGRGTKCVFLGFCCVDATVMMGVLGWGGGDVNVP